MRSIDIANLFIQRHGNKLYLTNLSLNKLVYFAQVEALKSRPYKPLFDDCIQAWNYGPVEPVVYHVFKDRGTAQITVPSADIQNDDDLPFAIAIVDFVAEKYGSLTAFDLVNISHSEGGAWRKKFNGTHNVPITIEDIMQSDDYLSSFDPNRTFGAAIQNVRESFPNALRMLEDA